MGNDEQVEIMSIEKLAEEAGPRSAHQSDGRTIAADAVSNKNVKILALEFEDDNFGSDPYNSTGQFCQIELKDKD